MDALLELRQLMTRLGTPGGYTPECLPTIRMSAATEPGVPVCSVEGPAFALMVQGSKRTLVGDRAFDYEAGQYLMITLEVPITAKVVRASREEPFLSFGMLLRPAEIAALLLESGSAAKTAGKTSTEDAGGVALSHASPELVDAVRRMVRLVERPDDVRVMAPMIEREILWRLLEGPQGGMIRQIGLADSRISQVSRAVRWLRQNYQKTPRMEELAELAGMSVSAFHRNFRASTAMSPLQYQKQIRLQEARARLMARPGEIAAVGFAVGYESPSQFSREYRRQFGLPPGEDAMRLQQVATS